MVWALHTNDIIDYCGCGASGENGTRNTEEREIPGPGQKRIRGGGIDKTVPYLSNKNGGMSLCDIISPTPIE